MKSAIFPAFLIVTLFGGFVRAQEPKERPAVTKLDGAWVLVTQKNGDVKEQTAVPEGEKQIKLLSDGRYTWTWLKDGKVLFGLGGRYKLEGQKYTEHMEYAIGDLFEQFIGKSAEFKWSLEGGKWHHKGVVKVSGAGYTIDEVWERAK